MCPQLGQNYVHIEHIEYLLSESIDCIDYVTGIGNTIQTPAYSTLHLLCIFNGQLAIKDDRHFQCEFWLLDSTVALCVQRHG